MKRIFQPIQYTKVFLLWLEVRSKWRLIFQYTYGQSMDTCIRYLDNFLTLPSIKDLITCIKILSSLTLIVFLYDAFCQSFDHLYTDPYNISINDFLTMPATKYLIIGIWTLMSLTLMIVWRCFLSDLITCIGYFYSHWPDDFVKMSGQ